MVASAKNILIGVFVLIASAIIVFILLFLHPKVGDNEKTLHVRFTDIDKINIGTRVTYAGRPIGEVVEIQELPDSRAAISHHAGEIYIYELVLKVDSSANVYNTDSIAVRTSGLLGEKNIDVTPRPLQAGQKLYLVNDQILYAVPAETIEDTLKQFADLSEKFDQVLDGLNIAIKKFNKDEIVDKIAKSAQNIVEITDALNQPQKWQQTVDNIWRLSEQANETWSGSIDPAFRNFNQLTERAHESWTTLDEALEGFHRLSSSANQSWVSVDNTLQQLQTTCSNACEFTQGIKEIIDYTKSGQGTIGRLFMGDDIYLRLRSIFHKGQTIANDINNFGILFQTNRRWQRLNAKRINLLGQLSSPKQFNQYFSGEVDEISTSLSQVSMILNKTACYPQSLLQDPAFLERFSDLLKRVRDVEDALEMYNEQVVDQECQ